MIRIIQHHWPTALPPLALSTAFLLSGCFAPIPPIAQGLPVTFVPTSDFDARIRQRFPIGSEEDKLVAELHAQHFAFSEIKDPANPYRRTAHYEAHAIACRQSWTVRWAADRGQITGIEARDSGELCL